MNFFTRFIVGIPTLYLVLAVLFLDLRKPIGLFVCPLTAPIVLFLAPTFGALGISMIQMIFGRADQKVSDIPKETKRRILESAKHAKSTASRRDALIGYLRIGMARGLSQDFLVSALVRHGWAEREIRQTLAELASG